MTTGVKVITKNRQAYHQYFIEETLEAGIELVGTEVKSIRGGKVNLKDSWISIDRGEAFVKGCTSVLMSRGIFLIKIPCE